MLAALVAIFTAGSVHAAVTPTAFGYCNNVATDAITNHPGGYIEGNKVAEKLFQTCMKAMEPVAQAEDSGPALIENVVFQLPEATRPKP